MVSILSLASPKRKSFALNTIGIEPLARATLHRTAALYSMVPAAEPVVRAFATSFCTRDSMCASGAIAEG